MIRTITITNLGSQIIAVLPVASVYYIARYSTQEAFVQHMASPLAMRHVHEDVTACGQGFTCWGDLGAGFIPYGIYRHEMEISYNTKPHRTMMKHG